VRGRGGARMRPLGIFYLYRVRLRARLVPEALAMVGIAVGVALLFASQVANTSLNGSVRQLTSGLVGQSRLQLEARSPQGFPESLLGEVQRTPGVRSAAPVLEAQVNVIGPAGSRSVDMIGADPRFVHLGGALLQHLSAAALARQRAFALPAPIAEAIGAASLQVVRLQVGARTVQSLLGVTLQESEIGTLVHSPVALAPLAYTQQLTGLTHRITRIFVQPQAGRDAEVRAALLRLADGHLNVYPADFDTTLFDTAAAPTDESTELFALISALVGFLFAFNAMLLTVPAKRALIADLRLDGYSQLTLIEVLLFDALVLGVLASLVGLALGDEISLRLFHASPGYLSFAFPVGSQRIVSWQSIVIAVGGRAAAAAGCRRSDVTRSRWPVVSAPGGTLAAPAGRAWVPGVDRSDPCLRAGRSGRGRGGVDRGAAAALAQPDSRCSGACGASHDRHQGHRSVRGGERAALSGDVGADRGDRGDRRDRGVRERRDRRHAPGSGTRAGRVGEGDRLDGRHVGDSGR
jgi:putative ABC transport system permease protein